MTVVSKRREDVLLTCEDEGPCPTAHIAYCLNYPTATVRRDLKWLEANGYVRAEGGPVAGGWLTTARGSHYVHTNIPEDERYD